MGLPQTNAMVGEVRAAGTSEDWDSAAGDGAVKWHGDVPAYVRERRERVPNATGGVDYQLTRSVSLSEDDVSGVQFARGDLVSFRLRDGAPESGAVQVIERFVVQGLEGFVRLTLAEAQ